MRISYVVIFVIGFSLFFGANSAFGQIQNSIVVTTDKSSYSEGETIFISGEVRDLYSGTPVSVIVLNPNGDIVFLSQLSVNADKKFTTELNAGASLMKTEGTYTVEVKYGTVNRSAETSFEFGIYGYPSPPSNTHNEITIDTVEGSGAPGCEETSLGCYHPTSAHIPVGGKVIFSNTDSAAHTFTSGKASDSNSLGLYFDSSLVMSGSSFEWSPNSEGTVPYFCMVHPWMVGEIIVGDGVNPNPTPRPPTLDVEINKSKYKMGDDLEITGKVSSSDVTRVLFQIINPRGEMIVNDNIHPSSNGNFDAEYKIAGHDWRHDGVFTLTVISRSVSEKIKFSVYTESTTPKPIPPSTDNGIVSIPSGTSVPGCEEYDECYSPYVIQVKQYGMITWVNDDSAAHTVTAGTPSNGPSGEFDSSLMMPNGKFSHKFTESGQFDYFCMVHPWMEGIVVVGENSKPYEPKPRPNTAFDLEVSVSQRVYDLGDTVSVRIELEGDSSQRVAVEVLDPRDSSVISRTVDISPNDSENIEFRVGDNFKAGHYKVVATASDGSKTVKDTAHFKIKSQYNQFTITSVESTDQQGNLSELEAGELGFIQVKTQSNKQISTLITVNLFDAELTSIGIGSIKTTLSSGESEMILSFMIPDDAVTGLAEIYVNAFSDWPSNGGIALTGEFSTSEYIDGVSEPTPEPEPTHEPEPTPEPTSINVNTDMPSYGNGDIIVVSGKIINYDVSSAKKLTFLITSPTNDIVSIGQISTKSDGTFSDMRIAGGPLWKITGDYIYELHYGADTGETMINYVGGEQIVSGQPEPEPSGDHELPQACVGCSIDEAREAANKMLDKIQVSIWTDNTSYFHNDVILVEGKVSDVTSGSPVTITVTSPLNSIVTQDQLPTYSDGSFKTTLNTGGSMWKYDGTFTIKANYDSAEKSDVVTVELSGGVEYSPNYSSSESVISVQTDDNHYDEGDTIVISGNVSTVVDNTLVVLQLYTEGNMVDIAQLTVAQDGSYSRTILSEGALWKKSGEYDVRVSYGNEGIAETKFSYTPTSNSGETTALYEVDAGSNGTFDVEYTIKGGMVNDIVIDSNDFALVVQINSSDEGFIIVDLPREFIDAEKQNDTDDTFIVQIDGIEVAYSESESNSDSRILEIDFEQGDSDIKIMGTTLIGDDSNSSSPNVSLTNPRIINAFGSEIDTTVNVNQQIQVVADITNHNISNQDFIFHIVIEEIGYEEWVSGSLSNTQSLSPSLSWTPSESGNFTVEISIFDNILNKNKLTDSITLQIGVN